MAPLRPVSAEEIESLAIGAWILGTGGGGSPYLALLNMRALYRQGAVVSLIDPLDLADDDLVAVVSNMGAPVADGLRRGRLDRRYLQGAAHGQGGQGVRDSLLHEQGDPAGADGPGRPARAS